MRSRAAKHLPEIEVRLSDAHGTASLGNKSDPLDELVFIQLSIRTPEQIYTSLYDDLYRLVDGKWAELLVLSDEQLLTVLRGGGMASLKLARLRAQLASIREAFGAATLDPLRDMDDAEAETFLRSLPGVGPKAARCVLMYSLERAVFPVDSHSRRVLGRLGYLPVGIDRKAADDFLQELVPARLRHDLHVNLVHHGRSICVPVRPRCQICPVVGLCPTGQESIGSRSASQT